jgi:HEAT repeat protein
MPAINLVQTAVLVIFTVNALLLLALIVLKEVHRRRMTSRALRRTAYIALIGSHLADPDTSEPIESRVAQDPAFLDALIDVRNTLTGTDVATLSGIVDASGVTEHQASHLRRRFPRGRRQQAAMVLAEIGDETSAQVLIKHLDDHEAEVRIQCARGLGRMGWTPAIDAIVSRLGQETPWVRSRFADTLVGFGSKATWPLVAYIKVNHPFEIGGPAAAIRALATIGDDTAVRPLIGVLQQADDPEIQIATVEALGSLQGPLAVPVLHELSRSRDWRLRAKAATALGQIGLPASLPVLANGLRDLNWWVRRNSARALTLIPGGIDTLYKALDDHDRFARDAAAEALVDIGELAAVRQRLDAGEPTDRDQALIGHMEGPEELAS